jgi:hypothetical protein
MTKSDGFNQIQIQVQSAADGSGDSRYQLNVQTPSGDVIVLHQRVDLGLIAVTVIEGAVENLINIPGKGRTPDGVLSVTAGNTAGGKFVVKAHWGKASVCAFPFDPFRQIGRQRFNV